MNNPIEAVRAYMTSFLSENLSDELTFITSIVLLKSLLPQKKSGCNAVFRKRK